MNRHTQHRSHPHRSRTSSPPRLAPVEISPQAKTISPFLSIWVRPRETIRRIVDTDPTRHVMALTVGSGLVGSLTATFRLDLLESWSLLAVLASIALGPLLAVITLYVGSALSRWIGRWLGGRATSVEVRAATAWSLVPGTVITVLLTSTQMLLSASLAAPNERGLGNAFQTIPQLGYFALAMGLGLWNTVIWCKCLGEVHRFSAWRAWATFTLGGLLGGVVVGVPLACVIAALSVAQQL